MQVSKFNFSREETSAISEREFFLLKSSATKKIMSLFGEMEKEIISRISNIPIEVNDLNKSNGKIFRGENYRLYPYIVLDCPRLFSTSSIFAFRTMFWWGHEFSFTLHLQGEAFALFKKKLSENFHLLEQKDVYYCVNDTPWQYNFDKENYLPLEMIMNREEELTNKSFIKISRKLSVDEHERFLNYGLETFELFMDVIKNPSIRNR